MSEVTQLLREFARTRTKIQWVDLALGIAMHVGLIGLFSLLTRHELSGADEILMLMIVFVFMISVREPKWLDD